MKIIHEIFAYKALASAPRRTPQRIDDARFTQPHNANLKCRMSAKWVALSSACVPWDLHSARK